MLIDAAVHRYIERAPSAYRANLSAFLAENRIDQNDLMAFALRPFRGEPDCFFVSTVVRGLAGSMSDLDLILVSEASDGESTQVQNLFFHADRRVGAKLLARPDVAGAFHGLNETSNRIERREFVDISAVRKQAPIAWSEVERLVNSVAFRDSPSYLEYLPALCRWAVVGSLQEFERQAAFARLALKSLRSRAALGYALGTLIAAMDAVMAACGEVQSNTKWTFERWRRFEPTASDARARDAVARVRDLRAAIIRFEGPNGGELDGLFTDLSAFFHTEFVSPIQLGRITFAVQANAHRGPFLPDADAIAGANFAAVIDKASLDAMLSVDGSNLGSLDGETCRSALDLLQAGVLSCAPSALS